MHLNDGGVAGPAKQSIGNGKSKLKTGRYRSRISAMQKEFRDSWGWHFVQTRLAPTKGLQTVSFQLVPTPCSACQSQLVQCTEQAVESVKVTLLPVSHFDQSR